MSTPEEIRARALRGLDHMTRAVPYPRPLPEGLAPWHVWLSDCGHNVLAVRPGWHTSGADVAGCAAPIPVRMALRLGFELDPLTGVPVVDYPYHDDLGVLTDPDDDEW